MLEKTLESPFDRQEFQPVHSKGDQSWVFIGRTDAKPETPILWPLHAKSWLIGKDPDAGRDWGQERGTTEDEMAGWQHWLNGHEFEQTLGDSEGQGSLVYCSPRGCREFDMTEWLNINMEQQCQHHLGANIFPTRSHNPRLHLGSTKLEYIYYNSWMICIYIKFWEVWL